MAKVNPTPKSEDSRKKRVPADLVIPTPTKIPQGIRHSSWPNPWDEEHDRVRTFPYFGWDGRIATWKVRRGNVPKEQRYRPNKSGPFAYKDEHAWLPYGLPKLRRAMYEGADTIFWTTGPTDTEPVWSLGHYATSFWASETTFGPEYVEVLRRLKEETGWDNQLVLVVDDDATGFRTLPERLAGFDSVFSNVVPVIPLVGKDLREHIENGYGLEDLVPLGPEGWDMRALAILAPDEHERQPIADGFRVRCFVDEHPDENPSVDIVRGKKGTLIRERSWSTDEKENQEHIAKGLEEHGLTWGMLAYRNRDGSLVGGEGEKAKSAKSAKKAPARGWCPDPADPREVARHIQDEFEEDGCSTILARGTSQFHYNGRFWEDVEERAIKALLWNRMDDEQMLKIVDEKEKVVRWAPTPGKIGALYDAVMSMHYKRQDEIQPGEWWWGQYNPKAIYIPMANGILQVLGEERKLLPSSPRYFNLDARPYAYDTEAKCPSWLEFLDSVFPDDQESIDLLQMWFGYVASGRTDLEKALALIGPTRAGKGVVCDACEALVGGPATASLRLSDLPKDFGLEKLIGKPLTIIPDNKGAALRADKMQAAVENLLSIIANDKMSINQKNKKEVSMRLATRVMMASNEIHQFMDASKAIDERLIIVKFRKSFKDNPDPTLKRRIADEAAGIFNWALDGLELLDRKRELIQPKSGLGYKDIAQAETPQELFVQQIMEIGSEFTFTLDELSVYWPPFAQAQGMKSPGLINHLPAKLIPIIERFGGEITKERDPKANAAGKRTYHYKGARIRPQESGPKTKSMNGVQL